MEGTPLPRRPRGGKKKKKAAAAAAASSPSSAAAPETVEEQAAREQPSEPADETPAAAPASDALPRRARGGKKQKQRAAEQASGRSGGDQAPQKRQKTQAAQPEPAAAQPAAAAAAPAKQVDYNAPLERRKRGGRSKQSGDGKAGNGGAAGSGHCKAGSGKVAGAAGNGKDGSGGGGGDFGWRVFAGQLPFYSTDREVRSHFEGGGCSVKAVRLLTERGTGKSRGIAFVELVDKDSFESALLMHKSQLGHKLINVEISAGGGGNGVSRKAKLNVHKQNRARIVSEIRGEAAPSAKEVEADAAQQTESTSDFNAT